VKQWEPLDNLTSGQAKDSVLIELAGGLGNQMFQYTLGQVLAKKYDTELILDVSQIGIGGTNHGVALKNFKLRNNVKFVNIRKTNSSKFLQRVNNSLTYRSATYKKMISSRSYQSSETGFDEKALSLNRGIKIKGYYQSFKYPELILENLLADFQISEPSEWFLMTEKLAAKELPIMMHVRRGDYMSLKNDFGVLSEEYYRGACAEIELEQGNQQKWVFSDSPELMSDIMEKSGISNWKLITPPKESSPNESLKLMSTARNLIMSNSTFSWWSAYLNTNLPKICVPSKWFKNREEPLDLVPTAWLKIPSAWES
jgi:hypothetical protein